MQSIKVKIGDKDCLGIIRKRKKGGFFAALLIGKRMFDCSIEKPTEEEANELLQELIKTYEDALVSDTPLSGWAQSVFINDSSH